MDISKLVVQQGNSVESYKVSKKGPLINEMTIGVKSIRMLDDLKWFEVVGLNDKMWYVNVNYVIEYMVDNNVNQNKAE